MLEDEDTTSRLFHFFNQYPLHLSTIMAEPSNLEVWEQIFIFFFGEAPVDDSKRVVPDYWRPGSTDPRWDTLLFKANMGAMCALNTLVEGWRNGNIQLPSHKEAA